MATATMCAVVATQHAAGAEAFSTELLLSTGDIRSWLKDLGLEQHADAFEREEVELDLVCSLSNADLLELGIEDAGSRHTILAAAPQLAAPRRLVIPAEEALPLQSVGNKPRRRRRLPACGVQAGCTAAVQQLTLAVPDITGSELSPALSLGPPQQRRSGARSTTLVELAAAARACTAAGRRPEGAAAPPCCLAAEQRLFDSLHPPAATISHAASQCIVPSAARQSAPRQAGPHQRVLVLPPDWRHCGAKRVRQEESLWAHAGACAAVTGLTPFEQRVQQQAAARAAAAPQRLPGQAGSSCHGSCGAVAPAQPSGGSQAGVVQTAPAQLQHKRCSNTAAAALAEASCVGSNTPQGVPRQLQTSTAGVRLTALREELAAAEEVVVMLRQLVKEAEGEVIGGSGGSC